MQQQRSNQRSVQQESSVAYWVAMAREQAARWDSIVSGADPELVSAAVAHFEENEVMVEKFPTIYLQLCILRRRQAAQARYARLQAFGRTLGRMFASMRVLAIARA